MSIIYPRDGETGFYLDGFLEFTKIAVVGQVYVRWQISLTNSFGAVAPNLVYDTLAVAPDGVLIKADSLLVPIERIGEVTTGLAFSQAAYTSSGAVAGTTYYVSYRPFDVDVSFLAGWSTAAAFTFGSARCSADAWRAGQ